ncbi:MAG: S1 RNA-binding domain-containing protein [Vicinamibacterales bacterium]
MTGQEDEFAALFEASLQAKRIEQGQTIEGTIVAIGSEVAFVNVGGKGEAMVPVDELKAPDGTFEVRVGDRIQALVISTGGELLLSRRLALGAATDRQIEDAYHARLPVEGKVEREIKGGYEVRLARQRAFCPISQIDLGRTADPAVHIGRVYPFRITEYKEGGRNIVVSRRALLEEEQRDKAAELRRAIVPGAVLTGRVASIRDFGAFVDLGAGIQGLLHVSEMSWSRIADVGQMVTVGEEITVKVLRVDDATQKIALGLKQLTDDPWATVHASCQVGQVRTGRITRVAEFGAFIELEPGVEALAHASTFAPTGQRDGWTRSIAIGQTVPVEILTVEPEKKRIGVAIVPEGSARAASAAPVAAPFATGSRVTGKVERHESFGVFVFLAPGRSGLIPMNETGLTREADVSKAFPIGSDVDVLVLEADSSGRRIRLSRKAILDLEARAELLAYSERSEAPAQTFGSMADKLRAALEPRKK